VIRLHTAFLKSTQNSASFDNHEVHIVRKKCCPLCSRYMTSDGAVTESKIFLLFSVLLEGM
jgi:hypothetical protein